MFEGVCVMCDDFQTGLRRAYFDELPLCWHILLVGMHECTNGFKPHHASQWCGSGLHQCNIHVCQQTPSSPRPIRSTHKVNHAKSHEHQKYEYAQMPTHRKFKNKSTCSVHYRGLRAKHIHMPACAMRFSLCETCL